MVTEIDPRLIDEASKLFVIMVNEKDRDKRVDLKIEINDICLRGKFDYFNSIYTPMIASMRLARDKC